ncbi:TPR repeat protein [Enhygromyxa salina]|uniref:TPR repeat protein n=1 Tax=Enhygromyxa salina TaxID=215803 RepID=A0A0C2D6D3_9BACT|nr:TPR repeat protein [Enhygromyxa salina]
MLADDFGQRAFILAKLGGHAEQPWWDMFVLVGATPEELERMRYFGQIPWWSSSEVHIAFWRPLTAVTHYLDYMLWPETPWLMHLHQLAWHGLACGLAWALYRRLASSTCAAGAAALGFSLTHLHVSAAAWLAHRNAVLVVVFALLCLLAHDRWRRDRWRPGAVLGPAALLAGLLAGEMGVAVLGFLIGYALMIEHGGTGRRIATLAPYVLVIIIWRVAHDTLGHVVFGSGVYVDPITEPLLWLSGMPERALELLVYLFGPPGPIDAAALGRVFGAVLVMLAVALVAARGEPELRRRIGFVACAVPLSLVPLTTTIPHDRVLVLATIGSCLAFGEVIAAALQSARTLVLERLAALVVIVVHYVLSPAASLFVAANVDRLRVESAEYPIAASLDDAELRRQSLVIVHAPNLLLASLLSPSRVARGLNRPNFTWVLHAEPSSNLQVRQIDARTLELQDDEGWLRSPDSTLMRSPTQPFEVGDEVATLDFRVRVLEVADGRPTRISVQFRTDLDDPSFAVVTWTGDDFEPCPAAGGSCPDP